MCYSCHSKNLARNFNQSKARWGSNPVSFSIQSEDRMADDLPYKAEYAKSGRSSCKFCKNNIDKDSLRVAKMVQVRNHFVNSCLMRRIRSILSSMMSCDHTLQLKWLHRMGFVNMLFFRYFSVSSLWRQGKEDKFAVAFLCDSVSCIANLPLNVKGYFK